MVKKQPFVIHNISGVFPPKLKKMEVEKFVFYVVAFDSIKIQTPLVPQNDRHNLSFVKYICVAAKKMTRNGGKMANTKLCVI